MRITLVSFYTDDDYYRPHGIRLQKECTALGIPHQIISKPPAGGYLANTRLKPFAIRELLKQVGGPVLWVDVDASVLKPLALPSMGDIMAAPMRDGAFRKWHVGTLLFNHTPPAMRCLDEWASTCRSGSDEAAFNAIADNHQITPLPASYFTMARSTPPDGAVIFHRLSTAPLKLEMKRRQARDKSPAAST